jgi:hypothetical protein
MVFVKKKFIHQQLLKMGGGSAGMNLVYDDDVNKGQTARNR